jgi:nicotinate-nucleotide pyrophosphorylase (carboxylating)
MINLPYLTEEAIQKFIEQALSEDIGEGDHSTRAAISSEKKTAAKLLVKDDGILAGVEISQKIFHSFDSQLKIELLKRDGEPIKKGDIAFIVEGSAQSILSTERLVLNCMQRMSGIATYTSRLAKIINGTHATLIDTRKTTILLVTTSKIELNS